MTSKEDSIESKEPDYNEDKDQLEEDRKRRQGSSMRKTNSSF
jgi:hypothetical protein